MRKIVAEFKIKVAVGDSSVSAGRNVSRLIKMRRAFGRSESGEQNSVIKRGTDLANPAAVVFSGSSVDNYARNLISGVPSALADRVIKGKCPVAFHELMRNGISGKPNVIAAIAGIIISAISADNRINRGNIFCGDERQNIFRFKVDNAVWQVQSRERLAQILGNLFYVQFFTDNAGNFLNRAARIEFNNRVDGVAINLRGDSV